MSWYKSPMWMFLLCSNGSVNLWTNPNLAGRWSLTTFFFSLLNRHHKILSMAGNNTQVYVGQCMDEMVKKMLRSVEQTC